MHDYEILWRAKLLEEYYRMNKMLHNAQRYALTIDVEHTIGVAIKVDPDDSKKYDSSAIAARVLYPALLKAVAEYRDALRAAAGPYAGHLPLPKEEA